MESLQYKNSDLQVQEWIADLDLPNEAKRRKARKLLENQGAKAVPALIEVLTNGSQCARWEAAEALVAIREPSAAPALVRSLEDESHDVRWAAMKALIELDRAGLEPLLQALTRDVGSVWLREGAHHILNSLKKKRLLRQPCLIVLQALDGIEAEVAVPWAAEKARESLFGPGNKKA